MIENSSYINLDEFEKFVRNRFKNIVGGQGFIVPRIAVEIALDYIFNPENTQPFIQTDTDCKKIDFPDEPKAIDGCSGDDIKGDEFNFLHYHNCECFICRKRKVVVSHPKMEIFIDHLTGEKHEK